jgi:hypothetical protein
MPSRQTRGTPTFGDPRSLSRSCTHQRSNAVERLRMTHRMSGLDSTQSAIWHFESSWVLGVNLSRVGAIVQTALATAQWTLDRLLALLNPQVAVLRRI